MRHLQNAIQASFTGIQPSEQSPCLKIVNEQINTSASFLFVSSIHQNKSHIQRFLSMYFYLNSKLNFHVRNHTIK